MPSQDFVRWEGNSRRLGRTIRHAAPASETVVNSSKFKVSSNGGRVSKASRRP
jgi:hypothetical protein